MKKAILINGNANWLSLADESVQTAITSIPYYALRDYQTGEWVGGLPSCEHKTRKNQAVTKSVKSSTLGGGKNEVGHTQEGFKKKCGYCGAVRVDNQLGLESVHDCGAWATGGDLCNKCYVCKVVIIFREVKRVLRKDGVLWLNIGDSYVGGNQSPNSQRKGRAQPPKVEKPPPGKLKPKNLYGVPWRVALALQADGWFLRSDCPWFKRNQKPESAKDRPNKGHEYIFILTKSPNCYFDMDAVRIAYTKPLNRWGGVDLEAKGFSEWGENTGEGLYRDRDIRPNKDGRHLRTYDFAIESMKAILNDEDVFFDDGELPQALFCVTQNYKGAHFATYPERLVELCLKASTSEAGACPKCKAPWERIVERTFEGEYNMKAALKQRKTMEGVIDGGLDHVTLGKTENITRVEKGWQPTCKCGIDDTVPCIVLDPFVGSGTTTKVARDLGLLSVGFDLSFEYLKDNATERMSWKALQEWDQGIKVEKANLEGLPLFGGNKQ